MNQLRIFKTEIGGREVTVEVGKYAQLSNGSCIIKCGDTVVTRVEVDPAVDPAQARIPALDPFRLDGQFTGSDGRTFAYASYEPAGAAGAPLVVWLHSGEECGTDVRIPLLAEKVTALAGEAFQTALGGAAFVLVPQTSEPWSAAQAPALQELIEQFAAGHPGADPRRIVLCGSGAGGAMTLQMLLHAPDFYAAACPISVRFWEGQRSM